ncbi:MAG: hypothetical protein LW629_06795 [Burkholderiales bacterium]|jgi:hypothetical protein|nr:hypothetical protein [Burkholderiales bacterium]
MKAYDKLAPPLIFNSAFHNSTLKTLQPELTVESSSSGSARRISRLAFLNTQSDDYKQRNHLACALGKLGIYSGSPATPQNQICALNRLRDVYPRPMPVSHPGLLSRPEAVELAYWLISGLNAGYCDESEKNRVLSAVFYLTRGIEPPAHLKIAFKNWISKSLANLQLGKAPPTEEKLEVWKRIVRNTSLAASVLQLDLRVPALEIAQACENSRLARFQINHPGSCAGRIVINEHLLQGQYRELTEKATFALGVACIVHEMTHAVQHALLAAPTKEDPFLRALALACALDGELPALHWLETFAAVPEFLPPNCLLPHEMQAWTSTKETLLTLGQNNPEDIKHIEQALLYISPTLKKMGLSNG